MSDPESVVGEQFSAYAKRDVEAFISTYAPDAVVLRFAEGNILAKGHDELRRVYGKFFANNPGLKCALQSRFVKGDIVVDHELLSGLTGKKDSSSVVIYEVKDGLIARARLI